MAVQFSAVTVSADDNTTKLYVGGIPQSYDDLEGWRIFEEFLGELEQETEVHIQAQSYLYGGEEDIRIKFDSVYVPRSFSRR